MAAALLLALGLSAAPAPALADTAVLDTVAFGGYEWLLIGNGARDADGFRPGEGKATLLAKNHDFGMLVFNEGESGTAQYPGSTLQGVMGTKATDLPARERALIVSRTLEGSGATYTSGTEMAGDDAENQLFWPLSKGEYGALETVVRSFPANYWLRSPAGQWHHALTGRGDGSSDMFVYAVDTNRGAGRPALWLDLSSALFTTAVTGGKAGDAGASLPAYTLPEGAYKFTMMDSSIAPGFTLGSISREGSTLEVAYSGAVYSENETRFVSALVKSGGDDFYGNVTRYGRLKAVESANDDAVQVELPEGFDTGTDTLYLFVEQVKDGSYTDFAGTPQPLDLTPPSVASVTPDGMDAPLSASLAVTFSEPMDTGQGGTVSLSGGSGAADTSGRWSEGDRTYTVDYTVLAYGTEYTVTVSDFRDKAGNEMADDSSHIFTTMAAPAGEKPFGEEEPPAEEAPPGGSENKNSGSSGGPAPAAPASGTVYPVLAQFGAWDGVLAQGGVWGGSGPATARIDADHTKFVRLLCDGAEVDPAHYTVTQGSTVVTLQESYLAALSAGTHTFAAEYTDGRSGDIMLTIGGGSSPKTGGDGGPFLLAVAALLASLALSVLLAVPGTGRRRP
ncbi:MAG: Ig-like domain-containing protein [Clostridium sp.]|nr:Ig-like domain-containing protein [Clostridium sp.]